MPQLRREEILANAAQPAIKFSNIEIPFPLFHLRIVTNNPSQQIIRGISLSSSGQATVDPQLTDALIDIAIKIDDDSKFPVDVEHVLAAIVLATRTGDIDSATDLANADAKFVSILASHVETVFQKFGGKVGADD